MTAPTITPMSDEDLTELEKLALAAQKGPWRPGPYSTDIWGPSTKGGETKIADIRGWGYLTGKGHGALGLSDSEAIAMTRLFNLAAMAVSLAAIWMVLTRAVPPGFTQAVNARIESIEVRNEGDLALGFLDRYGINCTVRFGERVSIVTYSNGAIWFWGDPKDDKTILVASPECAIWNRNFRTQNGVAVTFGKT